MGIAYLLAPVRVLDLDPKKILGDKAPVASSAPDASSGGRPAADKPLADKENLDLLASAPETSFDGRDTNALLEELLRMKERDGRDNALIHYEVASWLSSDDPRPPARALRELIDEVLKNGWRPPASDGLLAYLESWKPALDKVREGAALDYARGIGLTDGPLTPSPDLWFARSAGAMLCVEGRRLESAGEYSKALDEYLTALTVGRDHTTPGNFAIGHFIGILIERDAVRQVLRLARSVDLREADALRALARVRRIEETAGSAAEVSALEDASLLETCRRLLEDPRQIAYFDPRPTYSLWEAAFSGSPEARQRFVEQTFMRIEFVRTADRIGPDIQAIHALQQNLLAEPGWKDVTRLEKDLEETVEKTHFPIRGAMPNGPTLRWRHLVAVSTLREAQVALALAVWKRRHGEYPENLAQLVPDPLTAGLPLDPFSGSAYLYRRAPNGDSYLLWSVGPDRTDDRLEVLYDPSNGTVSRGDLAAGSRQ